MNHKWKAAPAQSIEPDGPCEACGAMTVYAPVGGADLCYECALAGESPDEQEA